MTHQHDRVNTNKTLFKYNTLYLLYSFEGHRLYAAHNMTEDKANDAILTAFYFNPEHPAAYAGPKKVFQVLNKKYPGVFSLGYITKWLSGQDAYALQMPVRHRFKTANVRVTTINEQWDIDLSSMTNLA